HGAFLAALAEQMAEEIVDEGVILAVESLVFLAFAAAGIAAVEGAIGPLGAAGVDLAAVDARPLLRIGQQVVGSPDPLGLLLDALVAGVEIRMQLLRQLPVGLLDVVWAGALRHAEDFIGSRHDALSRLCFASTCRAAAALGRRCVLGLVRTTHNAG